MENSSVSKIVIGFFMIIVGIVLIASVANGSALVTSKANVVNETIDISTARLTHDAENNINTSALNNFTLTNYPTTWKTTDCPITSFIWHNGTSADFTISTDYNFYASSGILEILNSTYTVNSTTNTTYASYTYCPDEYVNIAWEEQYLVLLQDSLH